MAEEAVHAVCSEFLFRIPKFALRISEFGVVKYMKYGQVVTVNLL